MSGDRVVRVCPSDQLDADVRAALRALLDAAFAGEFSDDDWAHALGGTHAIVETNGRIVAHASVVPRPLDLGPHRLHVGYVEAAAVHPERQRTGLGTAVMRALGGVIARDFALGALSTGEWHFYERLGWERWRGPAWVRHPDGRLERTADEDAGIMILRLPALPAIDLSAPIICEARPGDAW